MDSQVVEVGLRVEVRSQSLSSDMSASADLNPITEQCKLTATCTMIDRLRLELLGSELGSSVQYSKQTHHWRTHWHSIAADCQLPSNLLVLCPSSTILHDQTVTLVPTFGMSFAAVSVLDPIENIGRLLLLFGEITLGNVLSLRALLALRPRCRICKRHRIPDYYQKPAFKTRTRHLPHTKHQSSHEHAGLCEPCPTPPVRIHSTRQVSKSESCQHFSGASDGQPGACRLQGGQVLQSNGSENRSRECRYECQIDSVGHLTCVRVLRLGKLDNN